MGNRKKEYSRDWKKYNKELVRRRELYLDLEFLRTWNREIKIMNNNKVGSPYICPNSFIQFQGALHQLLHIDFRGIERFTRKLSALAGGFPVNDYSTICRRVNKLNLNFDFDDYDPNEPLIIVFDGSGVKVANRGEWIRDKYKKRKSWIKIVIAVDVKRKKVIEMEVGEEKSLSEPKAACKILSRLYKKGINVAEIIGDGSYDSKELFDMCRRLKIKPTIKIRENAISKARGSMFRKKYVVEYKEIGYEKWKEKCKYGRRWVAEEEFSRVKRKTGEFVMAKNKINMFKEVALKFHFYSHLEEYGKENLIGNLMIQSHF